MSIEKLTSHDGGTEVIRYKYRCDRAACRVSSTEPIPSQPEGWGTLKLIVADRRKTICVGEVDLCQVHVDEAKVFIPDDKWTRPDGLSYEPDWPRE